MPLYKHNLTGKLEELSEDVVAVFPNGTFELIEPESAAEARERERLEALANKVDLELDDDEQENN